MFHAPGGLAGVVGDTSSLLDDGFAMATTDTGHEPENDPSFYRNDHAQLDFGFRANHLTTVLAKRIIQEFYGRPVENAYLWGCSNGGRAALMEALRFPDDYDGIIAGAPAVDYGFGLLTFALETSRHQRRHALTAASVALVDANTKRACDMLDGVADGIVGDPRKCTVELLDLEALKCRAGPAADCLTAGQTETARFICTGITDEPRVAAAPDGDEVWRAYRLIQAASFVNRASRRCVAEREGFEPSVRVTPDNCLAGSPVRPLQHLSRAAECSSGGWPPRPGGHPVASGCWPYARAETSTRACAVSTRSFRAPWSSKLARAYSAASSSRSVVAAAASMSSAGSAVSVSTVTVSSATSQKPGATATKRRAPPSAGW